MSPQYIRALFSFIEGCQSILEVFLHASLETVRVLPMLTTLRAPFAFKALVMLKKKMENPDEAINLVIDETTLAWDFYSTSIAKVFEKASADRLYAYPSLALHVRNSIIKSKKIDSGSHAGGIQSSQTITTLQHTAPDIGVSDFIFEENCKVVNDLSVPFYPAPGESAAWPSDFVDFAFYSL
jgi:hypothetical protein